MARSEQIHPLTCKKRLQEAVAAGHLIRYFEGSTPETSHERHTMVQLEKRAKGLEVGKIGLYHGDFLSDTKSSVTIRLEEGNTV